MNMNLFKPKESIEQEMQRFASLRINDPTRAHRVFTQGELLITLANQGKYGKFQATCMNIDADDIYLFFTRRIFLGALKGRYVS